MTGDWDDVVHVIKIISAQLRAAAARLGDTKSGDCTAAGHVTRVRVRLVTCDVSRS